MQRITTATATSAKPAYKTTGAPGYFTQGNALAGIPATVLGQDWLNQVQEEIVGVITAAGLTPSATDDAQLEQAIAALIAAQAVTVPPASETTAGIAKLATQALVDAGVDDATAVTPLKLATRLEVLPFLPAGTVIPVASETVPTGYLECNGAAVSRTVYADLFAAIGTTHGTGDGSTTFDLPDYRGRFLRGWDHGAGRDPDRYNRTAMATGGATGDMVGTVQVSAIAQHQMILPAYNPGTLTDLRVDITPRVIGQWAQPITNGEVTLSLGVYGATISSETRPINAAVMYCIKY